MNWIPTKRSTTHNISFIKNIPVFGFQKILYTQKCRKWFASHQIISPALLWSYIMLGCLPYRWTRPHVTYTFFSEQSRRAVTKNGNIHDCVKLSRGFSQLLLMYVLFFSIYFLSLITESCHHLNLPLTITRRPMTRDLGLKRLKIWQQDKCNLCKLV